LYISDVSIPGERLEIFRYSTVNNSKKRGEAASFPYQNSPVEISSDEDELPLTSFTNKEDDLPLATFTNKEDELPLATFTNKEDMLPLATFVNKEDELQLATFVNRDIDVLPLVKDKDNDLPLATFTNKEDELPLAMIAEKEDDIPVAALTDKEDDLPLTTLSNKEDDLPLVNFTDRDDYLPLAKYSNKLDDNVKVIANIVKYSNVTNKTDLNLPTTTVDQRFGKSPKSGLKRKLETSEKSETQNGMAVCTAVKATPTKKTKDNTCPYKSVEKINKLAQKHSNRNKSALSSPITIGDENSRDSVVTINSNSDKSITLEILTDSESEESSRDEPGSSKFLKFDVEVVGIDSDEDL
ncbi:hypothetical protein AM593_06818, partial [Mytilus galloprovincialis]